MMNKRALVFLLAIAFLAGMVITVIPAFATPESPAMPEEPVEVLASKPKWRTPVQITNTSFGGKLPSIEVGTDGRTVLVAYVRQMTSNVDDTAPYVRKSTNNGATWANPVPISVDGPTTTTFVDVAVDGSNAAHAVWTEWLDNPAPTQDTHAIYYARENNWPAPLVPLSPTITGPGLINVGASIAARGNEIVIVWAENSSTPNTEIHYARSVNGGANWVKNRVAPATSVSLKPDVAFGADGRVHLVWQEGIPPIPNIQVMYSQRLGAGNWTAPIPISSVSGAQRALTPQLVVDGNTVYVAYTDWRQDSPVSEHDEQFVHHVRCATGCTNIANWQSISNPVSGAQLEERSVNPFSVKSTLARMGGCTYVYFHGVPPGLTNEQIFGVNSCSNWSAGGRDTVTPANEAAISPQMVPHNNWFLYMVYEKVGNTGGRTVWFVRNDPAVYLPIIRKP